MTKLTLFLIASTACWGEITAAQRAQIDQAAGAQGSYAAADDVYRVTFPRTDVPVAIEGRAMHPFMGFTDSPRVMFMHIGGTGTAERLATGVGRALAKVKEIRAGQARPGSAFGGAAVPDRNNITASVIDGILGVKGQVNAGMYKATISREATMHGKKVGSPMGVNTWAAFAGTDERALVDGDFAMTEGELQPVLRALRQAGIQIVAIHNHMTHEEPQYVFLHYWGKGKAAELARALRSALDTQQRR